MSQPLPFPAVPGTPLIVRGRRFRLEAARTWPDCVELRLTPESGGQAVHLLWPFDRPRSTADTPPRLVRRQRARHVLLRELASAVPCDALRSAASARIDLLPFQLEPALAVASARAHRLLLADAVGLGKTVQAALVLAELAARHELARALIATPPGLRDQWVSELVTRFRLEAVVVDLAWLRRTRASVGPDVNPWMLPRIAVVSHEFLKRPEIMRGVIPLLWDALVVDEAHAAGPGTDRAAALQQLARRARRVLLLTATPHAGDAASFRALCTIGALEAGEPLLLFRRSRAEVGIASSRRTHLLRLSLDPSERRLHGALNRYAIRVWHEAAGGPGARLAMEVLLRRACSGTASLLRSLTRRLALLRQGSPSSGMQLLLPLGAEDEDRRDQEPSDALAPPGLSDSEREQRWLAVLIEQARALPTGDGKSRRLLRLLRSINEPAIVFTEYRDTLDDLVQRLDPVAPLVTLHGGLGRAERADALRRFTTGDARVLLATDAAGEGLNLHARCRLVVNVELPWSPRRLEQRAGRVDRIGQAHRVHMINLVAGGTSEERVLAALLRRAALIRRDVGPAGDPIGVSDEVIARAMITGEPLEPGPRGEPERALSVVPSETRSRGVAEASRLECVRRLTRGRSAPASFDQPVVHTGMARGAPGRTVWLVLAALIWTDGADAEVERSLSAFRVTLAGSPLRRAAWRTTITTLRPQLEVTVRDGVASRRVELQRWVEARAAAAAARERALAETLDVDRQRRAGSCAQRALFDRRADRCAAAEQQELDAIVDALRRGIAHHERAGADLRVRLDVRAVVRVSDADRH